MVKLSDCQLVECNSLQEYWEHIVSISELLPEDAEKLIEKMSRTQRRDFQDYLDTKQSTGQNQAREIELTLTLLENYL